MSMLGYDYFPETVWSIKKFKPVRFVEEDTLYIYFEDKSHLEISTAELTNTFSKVVDAHNNKTICGFIFHLPSCNMDGRKRFSKKDIEKMINILLSKVKSKESKNSLHAAKRVLKNRGFI